MLPSVSASDIPDAPLLTLIAVLLLKGAYLSFRII